MCIIVIVIIIIITIAAAAAATANGLLWTELRYVLIMWPWMMCNGLQVSSLGIEGMIQSLVRSRKFKGKLKGLRCCHSISPDVFYVCTSRVPLRRSLN